MSEDVRQRVIFDIQEGSTTIKEVADDFERLEPNAKKAGQAGEKAGKDIGKGAKQGDKELKKVNKTTKLLNSGVKRLGQALLATFAASRIIQGIRAAIRTVSEYQSAVSELRGISGATDEQLKSLTKTARDFAKVSQFTATQVVKAQTELAKLGRTVDEINATTEAVLLLATAAGTEVATAAEVAAQTMNQFGIETAQAGDVADILAKSFTSSALTIDRFQGAFKAVGTTASVVGATLEQTAASVSALVDAGIPAEKAGTDLRNIYIELAKAGLTWDDAQQLLLNSSDKLTTATDLFGKRSGAAGVILAEQADKVARLTTAYENAEGSAAALAEAQLDNLKGDELLLSSAWQEFILRVDEGTGAVSTFARSFTQLLTTVVKGVTDSEDAAADLANEVKSLNEESTWFDKALIAIQAYLQRNTIVKQAIEEQNRLNMQSIDIADDLFVLEKGKKELIKERIDLLNLEQQRLKTIFADNNSIVDIEIRKLFLQDEISQKTRDQLLNLEGTLAERRKIVEQVNKENTAIETTNELTEEQLALRNSINEEIAKRTRELENLDKDSYQIRREDAQKFYDDLLAIEVATAEQRKQLRELLQRELDIINEQEKEDRIAREAEINEEIAKKRLELTQVDASEYDKRRQAAEAYYAELLEREGVTAEQRAEIERLLSDELLAIKFDEQEERLRLEQELIDGLQNLRLSSVEKEIQAAEQKYERLFELARGDAEATAELEQNLADEIVEINRRAEAEIVRATAASAASQIGALGSIAGSFKKFANEQGQDAQALALFEIGANAAKGVAGAVASGAGVGFPANLPAIATGVAAVLGGISQARSLLSSAPPSFYDGTEYVQRGKNPMAKDSVPANLHHGEAVITADKNKKYKGLARAFNKGQVEEWAANHFFDSRLANMKVVHSVTNKSTSSFNDKRMVSAIQKTTYYQKMAAEQLQQLGKVRKFKRAG